MSSLPPGVTDSMCEGGPDQYCATCGHSRQEFHEDDEKESCFHKDCDCEAYVEGEYEPDYDEDD